MSTIWITSSFLDNGVPKTGLTPLITVYDLIDNSAVINSGSMSEVANGIYKYLFSTYDNTKDYAVYVDGGATLDNPDRYQYFGGTWISPSETWEYSTRTLTSASGLGLASGSSVDNIVNTSASSVAIAVWDEVLSSHSLPGTAGSALAVSMDILNTPVDGIYTLQEVIQIMVAVLAGKLSGDTNTLTFRDLSDTINRIIVTVNNLAERTGVTINV